MRVVFWRSAFLLAGILFLTSCIEDDRTDCDKSGTISILIRDANYDNIDQIEGAVELPTGLPLLSYVQSMAVWHQGAGLATSDYRNLTLGGSDIEYVLDPSILSRGMNDIMVTANETLSDQSFTSDHFELELHPNNEEYADIYIGYSEIVAPVQTNETIWLYRTKGKLLVKFINLPANVSRIDIAASGVYQKVSRNQVYASSTNVSKTFTPATGSDPVYEMFIAPSSSSSGTPLTIDIYDQSNAVTTLQNININIARNKITMIKPEYNDGTDEWEVSALIDGVWKKIHNLDIQDS